MLSSSALSEPPEQLRTQLSSPDSPQAPEKKRSPSPPWQPPKQKKRTSLSESTWSMISSSISAAESFKLPQKKRNSSLPSISGITKPMIPNPNPNPILKRKSASSPVSNIPEKSRKSSASSTSTSYLLGKRISSSEDNSIWESPLSPPPDDKSTWESPLSPPPEKRRKSSEKKRKSSEKRRKSHEKKRKLSRMSMYSDISDSPESPPPENSLKLSRMSMYSDISDTPASPPPEKRRKSTGMSKVSVKSEQSDISAKSEQPQVSTQSEVNEPWYMRTLDPSAGPRGFARGLEPIKVLAATDALGDIMHLMQWKGCSQIDLVSHEETSTLCPHLVIEYYEQLLSWHNVPNLTDVILGVSNWKKKGYVNRYRDRYGKKGPRPTEIL
ncbi:histone-lysine N-methyltransferase 2D-like [Drosophila subobscura]|uniref:histone-lysine N-methyltransferase 2D-like n=1 Tax=Drosophila subobscura TaxID=7241 RepID=UPI00155B3703|nr:histone-lysine N-methyltransferase 2D-like [Drosophila subobscura]